VTHYVEIEKTRGWVSPDQKLRAVEILYDYLTQQQRNNRTPFYAEDTGASYVLTQIAGAIRHYKNAAAKVPSAPDLLDF
jgi:hypothetical protein